MPNIHGNNIFEVTLGNPDFIKAKSHENKDLHRENMFDTSNEVYLGDPCKNLIIFFRNKRNLKIHFLKISDQVTKLQFRMWKKTHSKQHCATFTKTTHDFSPLSLTFVLPKAD